MKKPSFWMFALTIANLCIGSPVGIITLLLGVVMLCRGN